MATQIPKPGDQIVVLSVIRTIHAESPLAGGVFRVLEPTLKHKLASAFLAREGYERTDAVIVSCNGEIYEVEPEYTRPVNEAE